MRARARLRHWYRWHFQQSLVLWPLVSGFALMALLTGLVVLAWLRMHPELEP